MGQGDSWVSQSGASPPVHRRVLLELLQSVLKEAGLRQEDGTRP
jgi:hypothetical protein